MLPIVEEGDHSCQVSRNDRDSPGIFAFVPVVSRLTQKADNVPDFSHILSSRALDGIFCLDKKTYKPGRIEESSFWHCFKYWTFCISIFRRGIIPRHAPDTEKGVWLTIFAVAKRKFISCPGCLIWKLGIYGRWSGKWIPRRRSLTLAIAASSRATMTLTSRCLSEAALVRRYPIAIIH